MKKISAVIICIILCVGLLACTAPQAAPTAEPTSTQSATPPTAVPTVTPTPSPTPTVAPSPTPTLDPTLKIGVQSEEVMKLQQRLGELGYLKISEYTTKYGPATARAVKLFQRQAGLADDGIAGEQTLARIYAEDAEKCTLPLSGVKIGLDPGHQAKGNSAQEAAAPGSSSTKNKVTSGTAGKNTGTPEYKVNLAVALKLRDLLNESGAEVIMTHDTADVDISNQERAKIFNDAGVDIGLRLHCDGVDDSSVNGAMMLIPTGKHASGFEEQSRAAGKAIFSAFLSATGARDRGIIPRDDQTGFNWSTVPVCNIEMGCLSNGDEEALLVSSDYQQKCAQGLADGLIAYCGK
ncbi:MAG: N-acetylmuramoyl-L-alanine amidase [Christensenella sp.]